MELEEQDRLRKEAEAAALEKKLLAEQLGEGSDSEGKNS